MDLPMPKKILHLKETQQAIQHVKTVLSDLARQPRSPLEDENIHGVYLFGSIIRGDFIPTVSDVDVAVVYTGGADDPVWQRESFLQVTRHLEERLSRPNAEGIIMRGADVVTYTTGEIKKAREDWPRFNFFGPRKFLGIYSFDLVENSLLIHGNEDILKTVQVHPPEQFIEQRIEAIAHNFERAERQEDPNKRLLVLSTAVGESARVACLAWGLQSLHKMDVFHFIRDELPRFEHQHEFLEFYQAYLGGIPLTKVARRHQPFDVFCRKLYECFRSLVLSRVS